MPAIILTGDTSLSTKRDIEKAGCVALSKPVKVKELMLAIQAQLLLPQQPSRPVRSAAVDAMSGTQPDVVYVVDDDTTIRDGFCELLSADGHTVEAYHSSEAFLAAYKPGRGGCLLIDAYLPGMSGLELLERLHGNGDNLAAIMITGNSDVPMAVTAMKAGAADFIEKPVSSADLSACVARALEQSRDVTKRLAWRADAAGQIAALTPRQREIMDMVLAGHPNKNIAADLGISQRTVENHRALIMKNTGAKSLPELARLALAALPSF